MSDFNNPHDVPVEQKEDGSGLRIPKAAADLKTFFGMKPGQKLTEFAKEVNELSIQDQIDLVGGIRSGTLTY